MSKMNRLLPLLAAATMFMSACAVHAARQASENTTLPLANFTGWSDARINGALKEHLGVEIQQAIQQRGLIVVMRSLSAQFEEGRACFTALGLSHMPPKGRNPIEPNFLAQSWATRVKGDTCDAQLEDAVKLAAENGITALLEGIEKTNESLVKRRALPADTTKAYVSQSHGEDYDLQEIFDQVFAYKLESVLDYRVTSTHIFSRAISLSDGRFMCVATAGFNSRAPEGRSARIPGFTQGFIQLAETGTKAECERKAALGAVAALMKGSWSAKDGAFKDFALGHEDGVKMPNIKAVEALEKRLIAQTQVQAKPRTTAVSSQQTTHLTCQNDCSNGNCVRTFPDGRKERWQAPRVFNPFTRNWEWQTNSCGG